MVPLSTDFTPKKIGRKKMGKKSKKPSKVSKLHTKGNSAHIDSGWKHFSQICHAPTSAVPKTSIFVTYDTSCHISGGPGHHHGMRGVTEVNKSRKKAVSYVFLLQILPKLPQSTMWGCSLLQCALLDAQSNLILLGAIRSSNRLARLWPSSRPANDGAC